MKITSNVPMKPKVLQTYPFDEMKPGDSLHFEVEVLRQRALVAFKAWVKRTGKFNLKGVSRAVGDDDPAGKGWRFWVMLASDLNVSKSELYWRDRMSTNDSTPSDDI